MDSTAEGRKAKGTGAPETDGSTTFALILKSIGSIGWGLNDLQKAADDAGLVWSSVSTPESDKHVPGELKAVPVARFVHGRTMQFSLGERQRQVRLVMNLQSDSPQGNALWTMRKAAEKLAQALGAEVQLEDGTPVTDESIKPAAAMIQKIHAPRRDAMRKLTKLPDGRRKETDSVIPWRAYIDGPKGGGRREWIDFDVEPLTYWRGTAQGQALMLELMKNLRALTEPGRQSLCLGDALGDALGVNWRQAVRYRGKGRVNVASGMLGVIEEALRFFARNANFERWLEHQIASSIRTAEHLESEDSVLREQRSVRAKLAHARRQLAAAREKPAVPLAKKIADSPAPSAGGGGRRVKRTAMQAVSA